MKEKWLITGATGLLGANACRVLAQQFEITAVTRQEVELTNAQHTLHVDLLNSNATQQAILEAQPSVILHAAALASHEECERDPELAYRMNVEATANVAHAAREVGATLIHISTDAVFDGKDGNYTEDSPTNPFSVYGKTKLEAENVARAYDRALVLRTNFFGWSPSGTRSILEFFVNNLERGQQVRGFTDFTVTSIYAPDLVETLPVLAGGDYRGVLHVASHDALTKYHFGRAVAKRFGLNPELIAPTASSAVGLSTPRSRDLSLNVSRAEQILQRPLATQEGGVRRALAERSAT